MIFKVSYCVLRTCFGRWFVPGRSQLLSRVSLVSIWTYTAHVVVMVWVFSFRCQSPPR
jgi:hypothetical protein